jgi:hypothetical protein
MDSWRHRFRVKELKISELLSSYDVCEWEDTPLLVNTFPTHKQYGSCRQGMKS